MSTSDDFSRRVKDYTDQLDSEGVDVLSGLFDLTSQRLVRLAVAITRNQHDAEDAVQSVLVRVAGRPELLTGATHPWSYLLRMVRNEALAMTRRKRHWLSFNQITDLVTRRSVDELEREETHRAVWTAMRKLPVEQAEVVVLKIWESMTFVQIARLLDLSPNTVASRYQYAMAKLANRLTRQADQVPRE